MENGTVWSNSSESSDDSSSPALAHHAQRLTASNLLQTTLTTQLSFTPHKSSASTPSLSSNQEEDETETGEVFPQTNGHLQASFSHGLASESSPDCTATDRVSVQSEELSETSADLSCSCPDISLPPVAFVPAEVNDDASVDSLARAEQTEAQTDTEAAAEEHKVDQSQPHQSVQEMKHGEDAPAVSSGINLTHSSINSDVFNSSVCFSSASFPHICEF